MRDIFARLLAFLIWPFLAAVIAVLGLGIFVSVWLAIPFTKISRDSDGNIKLEF